MADNTSILIYDNTLATKTITLNSIKTYSKQSMQSNKRVQRVMVGSEEVSLQASGESREGFCCSKCDREIIPQFGGQEREWSGTE